MEETLLILFIFCLPFFSFSQKNKFNHDQLNDRVEKRWGHNIYHQLLGNMVPCIKEMPAFEKFEQAFKTEKAKPGIAVSELHKLVYLLTRFQKQFIQKVL